MEIKIVKWSEELKDWLISVCNNTDRSYLTDRLPYPYTEKDADRWLAMVKEHDGKDSLFRAVVADGKVVGNITVEGKTGIYVKDAELGYILDKRYCGKGIATKAAELIVKEAFATSGYRQDIFRGIRSEYSFEESLEKNGFALEGVLKDAAYKNGVIYDLCRYGKLKN